MARSDIRFAERRAPREQFVLYARCLDEVVGPDDPVRTFWQVLEEEDWGPWEQAYEGCGQPPIHPQYLAGAIVYGLLHKVRSTRDLEAACLKHVDFLWMMEGFTPDHSTFADFRKRHAESIQALQRQLARKLVAAQHSVLLNLIIDGTRLRADSDRHGPRTATTLERVLAELDRRMAELAGNEEVPPAPEARYLDGMKPPEEAFRKEASPAPRDKAAAALAQRRAKCQKALDTARERDGRARQHNGKKAKAVRVPVTDPDAQVTPNKEGGYAPNYTPIAVAEAASGAIVVSDVATGSDEAGTVAPAIQVSQEVCGRKPDGFVGDGHFATGEVLDVLDRERIDAYMPTRSASPPDNPALREALSTPVAEEDRERLPTSGNQFSRAAFVYDAEADPYYCPMGQQATPSKQDTTKTGAACTHYQFKTCPDCPLASRCIKGKTPFRTITRDEHELLREAAEERLATDQGRELYKARAPVIEGIFAFIKAVLGIRRFSVRGLENVRVEWSWICTAYNLKRLLALKAQSLSDGPEPGDEPGNGPGKGQKEKEIRLLLRSLVLLLRHAAFWAGLRWKGRLAPAQTGVT